VVNDIRDNGLSLRKALDYAGCSNNLYYHKPEPQDIPLDQQILEKTKEIAAQRPTYGTRRTAAMLTRELGIPINRKRVQRIFRRLGYVTPSRTKCEIIRSKEKPVRAIRPNEVWEVDMTYIWCGIDGWGYLFNVFDVYTREWVAYCFDLSAVKENAIISVENALVSHGDVVPDKLTIRADNGSQYTSNAFRKSMSVLGLKLEHIAVNTPEQNGHIESFHKSLKKEYIWTMDYQDYQHAEAAIREAFVDYNQHRIHSSLGYLTPYEFVAKCKAQVINSA
jgi:putative transposase